MKILCCVSEFRHVLVCLFYLQENSESGNPEAGLGLSGDPETLERIPHEADLSARPSGLHHHPSLHTRLDGPQTVPEGW